MASATVVSWTSLDEQIRAGRASSALPGDPNAAASVPRSAITAAGAAKAEERSKALLTDWTRVLDAINEAGSQAQDRERRLAAQASSHDRQVNELRAEISQLRDQARANEARTEALLAAAEHRVKAAEERVQTAQQRAEQAEAWLVRIGSAVDTILLKA